MEKIVIVGGGGHVGLPLGLVLAEAGFKVLALDTSSEKVNLINSGVMPFQERNALNLLKNGLENQTFLASTDHRELLDADVVFIVIGTPVDDHLNPDPNVVVQAIEYCLPFMNSSQLVILRSTVFPGVTRKVQSLFNNNNLKPEVAFCPERILEGHAIKELRELPQIVGSDSVSASNRAISIFTKLGIKTISTSPEEAELAKLFTNVWRYIKFAAANQFWLMSNEAGLDYSKIREAIAFEYPRAIDLPSAGLTAGPCLFKDTMQLAAFSDNNFGLGHAAMLVNEGLPLYIVSKLEKRYDLKNSTVGILGTAFKAESDDTRSSLAYKLKKILEFKSKSVLMTDPFVATDPNLSSLEEVLNKSDLIILAAPHKAYREIVTRKPIIDIWNFYENGTQI